MSTFYLVLALVIGALLIVGLHRVWAGPTVFDRIVAIALVSANSLVMLIVVAAHLGRVDVIVDVAIAYALLAFTLPIALGKHFERQDPGAGS
jgi:multicomponent Na+:H+ antiporter subunit F